MASATLSWSWAIRSLVFSFVFTGFACRTVNQTSKESSIPSTERPADEFFADMYKTYNPYTIQHDPGVPDDCASFFLEADRSVPYKGVAVFFHGFSACPQQFYEMAQLLSKRGYSSLVTLMPGHGRGPAPTNLDGEKNLEGVPYKDYYSKYLPKVQDEDWKRYLTFVSDVNAFVKTLPGDKIVGGLSVGGSLATYAYTESPGLYKRALLISPYYGMPGSYAGRKSQSSNPLNAIRQLAGDTVYQIEKGILQEGSNNISTVANLEVSWGKDCYAQTRGYNGDPGRRGICDFHFENIAAINSLGGFVIDELRNNPNQQPLQIQYLPVEWDSGADTLLSRKAIAYQRARFGLDTVNACYYPNSVPHSMFSRKDIAKYPSTPWINSFLAETIGFLAEGKPIKLDVEPGEERQWDGVNDVDTQITHPRCSIYPTALIQ